MSAKRRWCQLTAWLIAAAVTTVVCGFVNYRGDSGVYLIKWYQTPVVMHLSLSTSTNLSDGSSLSSSVAAALQTWNSHLGVIRFEAGAATTPGYTLGNEVNEIALDREVDGEAFPSGVLALTMNYFYGDEIAESDIVFNSAGYTWDSYRGAVRHDRQDIRRVAVHELGHVLGLNHPDEHGQSVTAIMNSRVSSVETPQTDDINGVRALYGTPGVIPGNDAFANATVISIDEHRRQHLGSNIGATQQNGEPQHAGATSVHSVWWRWTAPANGTLAVDTDGSDFDTVLAVYTGANLEALTSVAANDDAESPEENSTPQRKRTSKVSIEAVNGTTYQIAVDGWGDDDQVRAGYTGTIAFNVQFTPFTAPVFTGVAGDRDVNAGDLVEFVVAVTGEPPPTLRWQRRPAGGAWADLSEGGDYVGTKTSTLQITAAITMDGDQYRCIATNRAGSVTSAAAGLKVRPILPPTIYLEPTGQSLGTGDTVALEVQADGATGYQWYHNGTAVAGATHAILVIENATTTHTGDYYVKVSNRGGSVNSATVRLTVRALPIVTNSGAVRQVITAGQSATFAATATGSGTLRYQWYHDGREIAGATSAAYSRTVNNAGDGGAYWVAATDSQGTRHGAPFFVLLSHERTMVVGWGADYAGQLAVPGSLSRAVNVSVGWDSAFAVTQDGTLATWGYLWHTGWTEAGPTNVVAVADGRMSAMALKADGTVYATGDAKNVPIGLKNVAAIACGASFALALRTDGTVVSWGGLTAPADLRDIVAIAAGAYHAVALKRDGSVRAWGQYGSGNQVTPPATLGDVIAIAAGMSHSLAVKSDGTVVAWGEDSVPAGLREVVAVSAGSYHSLALKSDGTVVAWGQNIYGQSSVPSALSSVFAIAAGGHASFAIRDARQGEPPLLTVEPKSTAAYAGGQINLEVYAIGSGTLSYQWLRNGVVLPSGTDATMALYNVQPLDAGLYTVKVSDGTQNVSSPAAIVGVATTEKVIGAGRELSPANIRHPNGNTFDQVLLTGLAETITSDTSENQITRTSFIDVDGDIVQVEFSGPGTLSVVLDGSSGPALAAKYNQPDVQYMKGHAGIVITGANETTHVSVFTVGRATAYDSTGAYNFLQAPSTTNDPANNGSPLFVGHGGTTYDGMADLAFLAISSTNGRFGGVRAANATFFAERGYTGIYAPGVEFTGPVYLGDVSAFDNAQPVLVLGSATDVRVTGGDMLQANSKPVEVNGITQLRFVAGSDSHGHTQPAQTNRAVYQQNGVDVTSQIVTGP